VIPVTCAIGNLPVKYRKFRDAPRPLPQLPLILPQSASGTEPGLPTLVANENI
jgi:hypothetical protein